MKRLNEDFEWEDLFKDPVKKGVSLHKFQHKYLFPFAEIAPLEKIKSNTTISGNDIKQMNEAMEELQAISNNNQTKFQSVMDTKYRIKEEEFGLAKGQSSVHWQEELKRPLQIT